MGASFTNTDGLRATPRPPKPLALTPTFGRSLPSVIRPLAILAAVLCLSACLGDPRAHLEKARDLTYQRQPAEALREYEETMSLLQKKDLRRVRSILIPALKGAGDLCYLEVKNYPKAVEYYRALTSKYPNAPETQDARANLSDIYRLLGDRRAAVAELAAIVQALPGSPEVDHYQYLTAKEYFDLGDYDQAILEAQVLLDRYPKSANAADAQMLIAAALALQGQRDKAVEAYQQVAQRWPGTEFVARAQFEQAKVLVELDQEKRAIDLLVEALETHPDPKGVQMEIARLRKRLASRRVPAAGDRHAGFPEWYSGN